MAVNKTPGKTLESYKGYKIFEARTYGTKSVIASTNLQVIGKKRKILAAKLKNKDAAKAFIDMIKL